MSVKENFDLLDLIDDTNYPSKDDEIQCPHCKEKLKKGIKVIPTRDTSLFLTIKCPSCMHEWIPSPDHKEQINKIYKQAKKDGNNKKKELQAHDKREEKESDNQRDSGSTEQI